MKKSDENFPVLAESRLLIEYLRKNPIMARLTDYALENGIKFLVHPKSGEMQSDRRYSWSFFHFYGADSVIFVPFDKGRKIILPRCCAQQIFCLSHELGHFKMKNASRCRQTPTDCPVWFGQFAKDFQDSCLARELLADAASILILRRIGLAATHPPGLRTILLNVWLQCPECLMAVSRGLCPRRRQIAKGLAALAKNSRRAREEITALKKIAA